MANKDIEIEIKLPLENPKVLRDFLNKNAKLVSENVFQKDIYFVPVHRDFLGFQYPYEWLRLRESAKGSSINYKHFHPENVEKTSHCDELETKVENIETIRKIFHSINMNEVAVVEKTRTTWMFETVEVVIDEVKDLGSYIELEAVSHFEDPHEARKFLYTILNKLNAKVKAEDLRGYPFRILEKKGYAFGK